MAVHKSKRGTNRRTVAATQGKLASLTHRQRESLKRWLVKEKLSYAAARSRLQERFGLTVSDATISNFWHQHCFKPLQRPDSDILLDILIKTSGPCRLVVRHRGNGVRVFKSKGKVK